MSKDLNERVMAALALINDGHACSMTLAPETSVADGSEVAILAVRTQEHRGAIILRVLHLLKIMPPDGPFDIIANSIENLIEAISFANEEVGYKPGVSESLAALERKPPNIPPDRGSRN